MGNGLGLSQMGQQPMRKSADFSFLISFLTVQPLASFPWLTFQPCHVSINSNFIFFTISSHFILSFLQTRAREQGAAWVAAATSKASSSKTDGSSGKAQEMRWQRGTGTGLDGAGSLQVAAASCESSLADLGYCGVIGLGTVRARARRWRR